MSEYTGQTYLGSDFALPRDQPFTYRTAVEAGVDRRQLAVLVREGLLRRAIKGVYLATEAGDSVELRARCLSLVLPPDCVICDRHAGWLLGAEMILAPGEHLHLGEISVYRPSGAGRLRNDLTDSGERNLRPGDVMEVHGLPVTTPLRTACDLGRQRHREQAIAGLDAMLRLGLFGRDELIAEVPRFRKMRWVTRLRELAPLADGRSESPGESVLRLRWIDTGLPTPTPQIEVRRDGILLGRVDIGNEDLMFAAEYDGAEWHTSPEQRAHDHQRRTTLGVAEWLVWAFTAANVWGRHRDCEELLLAGAREARARRGRRMVR